MSIAIVNYYHRRSSTYQALLCASFVTLVFALRWINCLPFSGYMPVSPNYDILGFWGRYVNYAKEPFGFPIGLINNLSFPFLDANISRGSLPIFAVLFKLLSKVYSPFAEFFYFIFVELLSVFLSGYFTCRILSEFKITSFWLKLIGSVLIALSFPLLYRSSFYFGATVHVIHFPLYLAFAYFYIRFYRYPNWKASLFLALIFPIAALTGYYILFGIAFIFCGFMCLNFVEAVFNWSRINQNRLIYMVSAFVLGICLYSSALFVIGNEGNLKTTPNNAFEGRDNQTWGYGGGFGGGFHVADVFTFVIPPKDTDDSVPLYRRCGPSSYLSRLGFQTTTNDLQDGQYEGFTYLGTTTLGILFVLVIISLFSFFKKIRINVMKLRLKVSSTLFMANNFFTLPVIMGVSSFMLFVLSWGYIIHLGGIRFDNIPTPSLVLAVIWPKFIFVRSLGRLAIPFMLFITMAIVISYNRYYYQYIYQQSKVRRTLFVLIILFLVAAHIYEIKGYLVPSEVTYGNEIATVFGKEDRILIKELAKGKKVLMVVPELHHKLDWGKICYSLAFHSNIPISGATIGGLGEPAEHLRQYIYDIDSILAGNIKEIINRYGNVAIATPSKIAEGILKKTDMPLIRHSLRDQDVIILTLTQ